MKDKIKDNLFSYVFALLLGGILTTLSFFISSNPVTSEEVKQKLLSISIDRINNRYSYKSAEHRIDKIYAYELDVGAGKSIILIGSTKSKEKSYRWISIFEKGAPSIIDKMVGRSGFYTISSLSSFEIPYFNSLVVEKVEIIDIDKDGTSEIHVRLKSTWADSSSVGPLIYSRKGSDNWKIVTLPSIYKSINTSVKEPTMRGRRPFKYFGMLDDKNDIEQESISIVELKKLKISEEYWVLNHNGQDINFTTLRNGGDYFFKKHAIKGYDQLQVLSFFIDGGAVLGPHYAVVNMFKFGRDGLEADELWNWESPIFSTRPLKLLEIDIGSIEKAGIQAHVEGDIFFGYTEFEKIRPLL